MMSLWLILLWLAGHQAPDPGPLTYYPPGTPAPFYGPPSPFPPEDLPRLTTGGP